MPNPEVNKENQRIHAEHRARQFLLQAKEGGYKIVVYPEEGATSDPRNFGFYKTMSDADNRLKSIRMTDVKLKTGHIDDVEVLDKLTDFHAANMDFIFEIEFGSLKHNMRATYEAGIKT